VIALKLVAQREEQIAKIRSCFVAKL
jgi:hypothetical protein